MTFFFFDKTCNMAVLQDLIQIKTGYTKKGNQQYIHKDEDALLHFSKLFLYYLKLYYYIHLPLSMDMARNIEKIEIFFTKKKLGPN